MKLQTIYEETEKRIEKNISEGNPGNNRDEILYFTSLIIGIVARIRNEISELETTRKAEKHEEEYYRGIKDSKKIELTENIIFEAMNFSESLEELIKPKMED